MGSATYIDRVGLTGSRPRAAPAKRLSTWTMTREAITVGFHAGDGFLGRTRGNDITRFRCAGRRFVSISHPDYVDHVLHEARLKYVKSNEYESLRAGAGINLFTDEGDSWAAHRGVLNPTFARRHLNGIVDLMIDPITDVTDGLRTGAQFDMHRTMVEATLRVVANSLFSHDFRPLVQIMDDLATRGHRHAERLQRLGLWGLMPRPVYETLHWLAFSGLRLPPPLSDMQDILLTLDRAVSSLIDQRLVHPSDSADLLNVLLRADDGTWPRRRIRDDALTFMIAGHETTANAISWFWYLMAQHTEARDRMLAEVDDVLGTRRACAGDLSRLPWTTACCRNRSATSPRCGSSRGGPSRTTSSAGTAFGAAPRSSSRSTTFTTTRAGGRTRKPSIRTGSCRAPKTVPARHICRSAVVDASALGRASR
jgi:cytochrome P450